MINILRYINLNRQSVAANVLSLVVGLTCCLLIAIWAVPEVQTDRCFAKLDRISIASGQQGATTFFGAPPAVAPFAMGGCPQVEQAARVTVGQRTLRVSRGAFGIVSMMSDPELFGIFDFRFVAGVPFGAADVDRCVVSRSTAERLFGTADAVDSLLTVGERTFRVCGVFEDLPRNVTLMRNRNLSGIAVLVPLASSDRHAELDELWYDNSYATYLLLHPDADATALAAALTARSHDVRSDTGLDIALRPLKDEYLVYQGNGGRVWLMAGIALLILSIACINFVNLATAAFSRQTVAVGIRKVMGASRARLVADYLLQTLLIVLGSLALALVAAHLLTPYFSLMIGKQVDFGAIANPAVLLAMAGAVALAVLLSGLYPALYLSSFRPLGVLHGRTAATGGGRLRTMLVTMQMMASVVLIVCCIVVKMQIMAFGSADLGYNRSDIICITSLNETQFGRLGVLRDRLQADPAVEAMSLSTATLTGWSPSGIGFGWDGMPDDSRPLVTFNFCDADFADTYQLRFAAGRFMREGESACVINRSFADLLAATDTAVIGRTITRGSAGLTVVGIVDGLRHGDYNELQGPYIIMPPAYFYGNGCLSVRFAAGTDVRAFYERVCRTAADVFGDEPQVRFLDDMLDLYRQGEREMDRMVTFFAAVAVAVLCIGLFGLATFMVERRRKEIGIRRVCGASVGSVVGRLMSWFAWPMLGGVAVGCPLVYALMRSWLSNYADRISLSAWMFVAAVAFVLAVAGATIVWRIVQAARTNPSECLRTE